MVARPQSTRAPVVSMGAVAAVLAVALVTCVAMVLAIGVPGERVYGDGKIRSYPQEPQNRWSVDLSTMQTFDTGEQPQVVGSAGDRWLVGYPTGQGTTYQLLDAASGKAVWNNAFNAGLGKCAITEVGQVGCAVRLADTPDGFYRLDPTTGTAGKATALHDTSSVQALDADVLRTMTGNYRIGRYSMGGREKWARTFANAVTNIDSRFGQIVVSTASGAAYILDPQTGQSRAECASCQATVYPGGTALAQSSVDGSVRLFNNHGDQVAAVTGWRPIVGPAESPLLTPGSNATRGATYRGYDFGGDRDRWNVYDDQLSRTAKPCGPIVIFTLLDGSRVVKNINDGATLGKWPASDPMSPETNITYTNCVGSDEKTAVFTDSNYLTGYSVETGEVRWQRQIAGNATVVDGTLVLTEGSQLTALTPN